MDPNEAPAVSVADLIQIAADLGIPQDHAPAIAELTIHKDLTFEGWVRTTTGGTRVPPEPGPINWRPGTLELIGVTGFGFPPLTGQRPGMLLADVGIVIYRASLKIPSGLAIARSTWRDHSHSSGIDLMPGSWRHKDITAAEAALRWLETLPPPGVGRPPGATPGSKQEYWRVLAEQIGLPAAHDKYMAETPRGGNRSKWWDDYIVRPMRRPKHRK